MYQADELEIWNLTPGVPLFNRAQRIFNIVGNLKHPQKIARFSYSLNQSSDRAIFFKDLNNSSGRLQRLGDFNIDTIKVEELKSNNRIVFRLVHKDLTEKKYEIDFPCKSYNSTSWKFRLDLEKIDYPEQVGQFIDGKWRVKRDKNGESCLEISKQDAGHDRIILFGHHEWTHGYEITARLCITDLTDWMHNLGILFKWNQHLQGDGTWLPTQWSTGLGYYCSYSPGLRIRFGVDVHFDAQGTKVGDYVLQEYPLSFYRYFLGKILQKLLVGKIGRISRKLLGKSIYSKLFISQISLNKHYCFRLLIAPEKYALTVWEYGKIEPSPQLIATKPVDRLPQGAVGIIAHQCGMRVYDFQVNPI